MNSITASTVSPYTLPLLQDPVYNTSASLPIGGTTGYTPALYFPNLQYPTCGKFTITLYNTAINDNFTSASVSNVTTSVSMSLQDSTDGVTFTQIARFPTNLLTAVDVTTLSSSVAGNVVVFHGPTNKPYLRGVAIVNTGSTVTTGGITGSFGIITQF